MRFIALMFFVMMFFSSAAIAKMNADADLCEPGRSRRSVAGANVDDRIRDLSKWMKEAKGQALANALLMRASLYREKHDWRLAIGDLDRAEVEFARVGYPAARFSSPELPSAHASLLTDRGVAYREAGEYQKALRDFDAALQDSPDFSHGYIERGVTNLRADRGDRAIEDFNHVIVNDSNMTGYDRDRAYGLRASAWLDKEKESYRAEQDTNAASALSYKLCDEVADNFCWLYALWGRWRNDANDGEALVRYWRGNLLSGCSPEVTDRPNLLDSQALVYLQLGQLSDARTSAEAAIRGDPSDGEKYYMLAMIKEVAGDGAGAEVDFAKARSLAKSGDWDRWERQQGKFRKLPLPESLDQRAVKIVDESFKALEKAYSFFSLDRPIPNSSDAEVFKGMTHGNSLRLNWAALSSSDNFNLPAKSAPVQREIEACFLLEDPKADMDRRAECVRLLAARYKDS